MAIVLRLDRMLVERKMTLTELANRVGISVANLSILKTGKAKAVRLATLDAICRELSCQPGDLLEYATEDTSTHEEFRRQATDTHHQPGSRTWLSDTPNHHL